MGNGIFSFHNLKLQTMLTRRQAHALERAHRLKLFFDNKTNKIIIATYEPFADEVDLFYENLQTADGAAAGKSVKTDVTDEKTAAKHAASNALGTICRKTKAYAIKYRNPTLAGQVNLTGDVIFKKKDEDIQGLYTALVKLVSPLLADAGYMKYGVTQATLDGAGTLVNTFHGMIGEQGVNDSDYTTANTAVSAALKLIAGNVEQCDLLVDDFGTEYAGFVEGYHINARLGDDVIRHNGIQGIVTDKKTGAPVAKAIVKLEGTDKVAVSDITGAYRLIEVTPGFYNILVDAPGFEEVKVLHRILKGEVETMNFEM
jgi:hypothetical protein